MGSGVALSRRENRPLGDGRAFSALGKRKAGGQEISIPSAQFSFPMVDVHTVLARPLIENVSLKENRRAIPDQVKERRSES